MSSWGSKDAQIHIANLMGRGVYVIVTPDEAWVWADVGAMIATTAIEVAVTSVATGGAAAPAAAAGAAAKAGKVARLIKSAKQIASAIKELKAVKKLMDVMKKTRTIRKGVSIGKKLNAVQDAVVTTLVKPAGTREMVEAANAEQSEARTKLLDFLKENAVYLPFPEFKRVGTDSFLEVYNAMDPSYWGKIAGADTANILIVDEKLEFAINLDSGADDSWIVTSAGVVRAKYGHVWVPDYGAGIHPWPDLVRSPTTATYGGDGGYRFDDFFEMGGGAAGIASISLWHGDDVVRGLQVKYRLADGRVVETTRRGEGGTQATFELAPGEMVAEIHGRSGSRLDQIEFVTNRGRKFGPFGGEGGQPFHLKGLFCGFFGRCGATVDALAAYKMYTKSDLYGGHDNPSWDDITQSTLDIFGVESIRIWANTDLVQGIQVSYRLRSGEVIPGEKHGKCGSLSQSVTFTLHKNEVITEFSGGSGSWIDQLQFRTSENRVFGPYGGKGGKPFCEVADEGAHIAGFFGSEFITEDYIREPHVKTVTGLAGLGVVFIPQEPGRLMPDQPVYSPDGAYYLVYQQDGNLVLYRASDQKVWWVAKDAYGFNGRCFLQDDGNLVIFDATGYVRWASNSGGHKGASLTVQNDGNAVIKDETGAVVWSTQKGREDAEFWAQEAERAAAASKAYWDKVAAQIAEHEQFLANLKAAAEGFATEAAKYIPSPASPATNSTVTLQPTLTWTAPTGTGAWADAYQVEIATDAAFANLVYSVVTPLQEPELRNLSLAYGTTYHWRVAARKGTSGSPWSQVSTFTTPVQPAYTTPRTPTLETPANGATSVQLPPTLTWAWQDEVTHYGLQVSTEPAFLEPLVHEPGLYRLCAWPLSNKLAGNTTYYWRVIAKSGPEIASAWSNVWSFTTVAKAVSNLKMWGDSRYQKMPENLGAVKKVVAGPYHTVALLGDGKVLQWGDTDLYQLPPLPGAVVDIAAGNAFTAVLMGDGMVKVWKTDGTDAGQLNAPAGLGNVKAIAAGYHHLLALLNDGTVKAWGANQYGQTTVPTTLKNVKTITGGGYHSVALLDNGTVVCFGGYFGNLETPSNVAGIKAIAAGKNHVVALTNQETVIQWGHEEANYTAASPVPLNLTDVIAIAACESHTAALKYDGTVTAWGLDESGETKGQAPANAHTLCLGKRFGAVLVQSDEEKSARMTAYTLAVEEARRLAQAEAEAKGAAEKSALDAATADLLARIPPAFPQLARWKFNGDGNDATGQGHTAQAQGGVTFSPNFFKGTAGATFDGESGYMLANAVDVGKTFTLTAWVFMPAPVKRAYTSFSTIIASSPVSGRPDGFKLFVDNQAQRLVFESGNSATLTEYRAETQANAIPEGKWVFVAVVVKPPVVPELPFGYATLYVDGGQAGSGYAQKDIPTQRPLYFGYGTLEWGLKGTLADVRLYNTAMTPDEVKAVYLRAESEAQGVAPAIDAQALALQASRIAEEIRITAEAQARAEIEAKTVAEGLARQAEQARLEDEQRLAAEHLAWVQLLEEARLILEAEALAGQLAPAAAAPAAIPPLAHWKFNGDGSDASGNGRTATLQGGAAFTATSHQGGPAVALNGMGAYVDAGAIEVGDTFTLCAWFFLSAPLKNSINTLFSTAEAGAATNGFKLFVNSWNTQDLRLSFETGNGSSGSMLQTEPSAVTVGQWHHVAVGVDRAHAAATLYLNGTPVPASGTVRNDFATHRLLHLGRFVDGYFHLQGEMADVRLYNQLLLPTDLAALARPDADE